MIYVCTLRTVLSRAGLSSWQLDLTWPFTATGVPRPVPRPLLTPYRRGTPAWPGVGGVGGVVARSLRLKSILLGPKSYGSGFLSANFYGPPSLSLHCSLSLSFSPPLPSVLTARNCSSLLPFHYICSVLFIYLSTQSSRTPSRLLDTFASYLFLRKRLIYQSSKNKNRTRCIFVLCDANVVPF